MSKGAPEFVRRNFAIRFLLDFYDIFWIKEFIVPTSIFFHRKKLTHNSDTLLENVLEALEYEINQTIQCSNRNAQVALFESLKDWRNDYRIREVATQDIMDEIEKYNAEHLRDYEKKIKNKEDEYFVKDYSGTTVLHRKHLEIYYVPRRRAPLIMEPGENALFKEITNYHYYCVEETPELIPTENLDKYFAIVHYYISRFQNLVDRYIYLYDQGKVFSSMEVTIPTLQIQAPVPTTTMEPQGRPEGRTKINWDGSAHEFATFFAPLITDHKLYLKRTNRNETDPIVEMLYGCFKILKENQTGEIQISTLKTNFKNFNAEKKEHNTKKK